jgi:signal transduction histidine kinase
MSETVPAGTKRGASEVDGRRRTLADQELINSLGWLVTTRWFAGVGAIGAAFVAAHVLRLPIPEGALYGVGLFILAYNAALFRWRVRLERSGKDSMEAYAGFARAQIGLDWLAMTVLTALSGGIESPAIIFFLFHISIAALLLPHARAFLYVALAPGLVTLVALLEYVGVIPHVALYGPSRHTQLVFVGSVLFFFTAACYLLAYLCVAIAVRLRRREKELGGLYQSVRDTTATLDLETVLNRLVESTTRALDCKGAAIRLLDPKRNQVAFAATYGLSDDYVERVPLDFQHARLDQATLVGEPLLVADVGDDPRVWNQKQVREEGIASMLSVPLAGKSGPLGVLRAYGGEGYRFSDGDAAFLELVAAHGAVAIENAQAYRMLEDLDREKSRFIRVATHELRSPISVTESLLTALAEGYVGDLLPAHLPLIQRALRRVQALRSLVNDLLDLASGKAETKAADRRRVAVNTVVARVCDRFQARAVVKGISLAADLPPDELEVLADPADVERLVANLVENAVKYTTAGSVRATLAREGDTIRMAVVDTGIGIPEESLPKLFQEFHRARNAKALDEVGTGLGLTVVKDLVDRYEGRITVDSREGAGTTVTVWLPLAPGPAAEPPRPAEPRA